VKKGLAGEPEFAQPPAADALEAGFFQDANCDWHKSSLSLLFGNMASEIFSDV
jgi:hypothetical protein